MKMKRYGVRPVNKPVAALAEGDAAVNDADGLLNKVKDIYSGASGAAKNFFEYASKKFNISTSNANGFINTLKMLCAGAAGISAGRYLAKAFTGAVSYTNAIIARMKLDSAIQKLGASFFKKLDKKVLSFTIMSALISLALYKIYKIIINNLVSESGEINNSVKASYKELAIQKSIMESAVLFDKSARMAKSDLFTEVDAEDSANGIMAKAAKVCKEMFDGISKRGIALIKKHQDIITAILLCVGFVSAFIRV